MTPRSSIARLAQRTSTAITTAALALGLAATVLAPNAAYAAPAQEIRPDLKSGVLLFRSFSVGERDQIPVILMNDGSSAADRPQIRLITGPGLKDVRVTAPNNQFLCTRFTAQRDLLHSATCGYVGKLGAGASGGLIVTATVANADGAWVSTTADPDGVISEGNERNNSGSHNVVLD